MEAFLLQAEQEEAGLEGEAACCAWLLPTRLLGGGASVARRLPNCGWGCAPPLSATDLDERPSKVRQRGDSSEDEFDEAAGAPDEDGAGDEDDNSGALRAALCTLCPPRSRRAAK